MELVNRKEHFIASLRFRTARAQTTKLDICLIAVYCLIQFTIRLIARCNWKWTSCDPFRNSRTSNFPFEAHYAPAPLLLRQRRENSFYVIFSYTRLFSLENHVVQHGWLPFHRGWFEEFCDHYFVSVRMAIPLHASLKVSIHISSEK